MDATDFANAGGLLFLFAYGGGPWSVDARRTGAIVEGRLAAALAVPLG